MLEKKRSATFYVSFHEMDEYYFHNRKNTFVKYHMFYAKRKREKESSFSQY